MPEQKKAFPMLPVAHWWALRKKFKQTIPGLVTDSYLATVLNTQAQSARANVLPFLKSLGIINEDGKPTDRANEWRDDGRYSGACKAILKEVYPQELLDAVPNSTDREQAESWFSHKTKAGEAAVARMAVLYCVILEADASKQPDEKTERARPIKIVEKKAAAATPMRVNPDAAEKHAPTHSPNVPQMPGININLEIHISADSSVDQIDAIFQSMSKHIYKRV